MKTTGNRTLKKKTKTKKKRKLTLLYQYILLYNNLYLVTPSKRVIKIVNKLYHCLNNSVIFLSLIPRTIGDRQVQSH